MRRDRWAQVALEGHSPPPAETGAVSVGPAMAGLRGWLFTRPLPLPRSQSLLPWGYHPLAPASPVLPVSPQGGFGGTS